MSPFRYLIGGVRHVRDVHFHDSNHRAHGPPDSTHTAARLSAGHKRSSADNSLADSLDRTLAVGSSLADRPAAEGNKLAAVADNKLAQAPDNKLAVAPDSRIGFPG